MEGDAIGSMEPPGWLCKNALAAVGENACRNFSRSLFVSTALSPHRGDGELEKLQGECLREIS